MRVEVLIGVFLFVLALFSVYLTVCGSYWFALLFIAYLACSYFIINLNNGFRYFALILLSGHSILNFLTLNLLYGTGRYSNAALQVFLDDFDETRFLIEIGVLLFLSCTSLVLLLMPTIALKFKSNA